MGRRLKRSCKQHRVEAWLVHGVSLGVSWWLIEAVASIIMDANLDQGKVDVMNS